GASEPSARRAAPTPMTPPATGLFTSRTPGMRATFRRGLPRPSYRRNFRGAHRGRAPAESTALRYGPASGGPADVVFDAAVADVNGAMGERRDVGLVCHENDGVPCRVESSEEPHDFEAGFRIEVPRGLIREQDGRVVDERARGR